MGRRRPDVVKALLLAVLAGCASPPGGTAPHADLAPERVVREIETTRRARFIEGPPGLTRVLTVEISIAPKDPLILEIVGLRPGGGDLGDGLLEVHLRWKDFVGTQPTSFGGSRRTTVPFGPDGVATRSQAFLRQWIFELPEPEERVLARRVSLTAKLHPVDVLTVGARTAGRTMEVDGLIADSFRVLSESAINGGPEVSLSDALADASISAAAIFLQAVGSDHASRDIPALVGGAVAALESARGPHRDALFGALQFMTGQTQGRSVARWQLWWSRQSTTRDNNS